jgi:hydrogenase nickel incorporation protein HypA/HybF
VHELSIAEAVVRIAEAHAVGHRVAKVELRVGHLRQVVPSALEFAFELVAEGTTVEGAELELEEVAAAGICRACGAETPLPDFPLHCAACGGLDVEVTRGEELLVDSLELESNSRIREARMPSGLTSGR